jgi:hypothetical protein
VRRHLERIALALAAAACVSGCRLLAPEPGPPPRDPGFADGVVFDDRDGDGRRGAGEPGIPGVAVSNGRDVVRSDRFGRYRLALDDDTLLFVVKPSGWATPLSPERAPRFHHAHKPAGSPPGFAFPGVAPTGPLPASVDFPLRAQAEPTPFRAIVFGDTQPKDLEQLDFLARDIVADLVGSDAAFGVTLGDNVHDDLSLLAPLDRLIARIGVPWYHVLGNHDMNFDAQDDAGSDETFERMYGPSTYAFEYARAHFLVLDDVIYGGAAGETADGRNYHGGFSERTLAFVRAYLAGVPRDELVVALMHMPFAGPAPFSFAQGRELLALLSGRPHTVSLAAHAHMQYQLYLGEEAGFAGGETAGLASACDPCAGGGRGRGYRRRGGVRQRVRRLRALARRAAHR